MSKKTAKHRAEPRKVPLRNRVSYAKNRWHLAYKPTAKRLLVLFMTKGMK